MTPRLRIVYAAAALLAACPAAALKSDRDQPVKIQAASAAFDEKRGFMRYSGDVRLRQGSTRISAERIVARSSDGETQWVRAEGQPLRLETQNEQGERVRIEARELEYHAKKRELEAKGRVSLRRGGDVFQAAYIYYHLDEERLIARGAAPGERIDALFYPRAAEKNGGGP